MADLFFGLFVGNDRPGVHLRTGSGHGQYTAHGHNGAVRFLKALVILFPGILFTVNGNGKGLGVVADGAAAHGQKKVGLVFPGDPDAFIELFQGGVGHHAANLRHIFSVSV